MEKLDSLVEAALRLFAGITDAAQLEQAKARYLGKAGALTEMQKDLGKLPAAERPAMGARFNSAKQRIEAALNAQREKIQAAKLDAQLALEALDVTLPGRGIGTGGLHPVTRTLERVEQLFRTIGFEVADGPEIETDYHNFTALNLPPEHPARQMHDTFYLPKRDDGTSMLLRTHTSPVQIRHMMANKPPYRIIAPGRTYRSDSDQTHTPMFHQVEGLVIDRNIHMGHLKGCLEEFVRAIFQNCRFHGIAGDDFNPNSPKQILDVLASRGVSVTATDKATLSAVEDDLARLIVEQREANKIKTTYFDAIWEENVDGILHPHFRQHGTRTGRMSSGAVEA